MPLALIDPKQIKPNPWQPRLAMNPARIAELADDIAARGLLQPPVGRAMNGGYELAFGHRRFEAWKRAKPGAPFPLEVHDLTDREMAEHGARENGQREDLNPVERARSMKRLMDEFHLTQLEAGKLYGLATQGAVSNVLRLLQLPEAVLTLLASGELSEHNARSLLPLCKFSASDGIRIAQKAAQSDDPEDVIENGERSVFNRLAKQMHSVPWDLAWPGKPIPVTAGALTEVPACKGCEFHVQRQNGGWGWCTRPSCWDLKHRLFGRHEAARIAKKLGLTIAGEREKTTLVFDGSQRDERMVAAALVSKHASLCISPLTTGGQYDSYNRKRILGSESVELHTTDLAALRKAIAALPKAKKVSAADKIQSSYDRQHKERAEKCRQAKALARAAAPHVAQALTFPEPLLDIILPAISSKHWDMSSKVEARAKALDTAGKQVLIAECVITNACGGFFQYGCPTPSETAKKIEALARALKVRLPRGWDAPPPTAKKGK